MSPITHLLISWTVANAIPDTTRRERIMISLGGIVMDIDGLGAIPDTATRWFSENPTRYFHEYHHLLHTGLFAAICFVGALALARGSWGRRAFIAALVMVTFHIHLLCDVAGSKGPDGSQWPIPYLYPFLAYGPGEGWTWAGQWRLDAWPNMVITGTLIASTFFLAVRRGFSILEIFSLKADAVLVRTLRARFAPHRLAAEGESDAGSPQEAQPSDDP